PGPFASARACSLLAKRFFFHPYRFPLHSLMWRGKNSLIRTYILYRNEANIHFCLMRLYRVHDGPNLRYGMICDVLVGVVTIPSGLEVREDRLCSRRHAGSPK